MEKRIKTIQNNKKEETIKLLFGEHGLNKYKKYSFEIKKKSNPNFQLVNKNSQLKNLYLNKRCFVLGNGPSLKNINFSDLSNEFVFTVNNLMKMNDFEKLNANFHVWADEIYWSNEPGASPYTRKTLKKNIQNLYNYKDIKVFYPTCAYYSIKNFSYADDKRTYYFEYGLNSEENMIEKIDLINLLYKGGTVVQYAIQIAIYMGFKEIYLLGCDNTAVLNQLQYAYDGKDQEQYVYNSSHDDQKRLRKYFVNYGFEKLLKSEYLTLKSYRALNKYCKKNNIKIQNLSQNTTIDNLERNTIDNILNI